jgi:hypothetical protein
MEFLEVPLFDDDVFKLLIRFAINVFFLAIIVKFAIYPSQREREFAFTAVMMNVTVFFICFSLKKLELGIGMALGLFAIFGVLRYRTDAIRVKEMTYLFIVIGIAVINSLSNKSTSYVEVATINFLIFGAALLKERVVGSVPDASPTKTNRKTGQRKQLKHTVDYDKLEWLSPEFRAELLTDLRNRTGIHVIRAQVRNIDLRDSTATLTIWYDNPHVSDAMTADDETDPEADT